MIFDICLMRLQFKRQRLLYIFPMLFLYLFLLPYQGQLFASGSLKEEIVREIFSLNQKYLILFSLWYTFLCFRMILSDEMKEVSRSLDAKHQVRWVFYWQIVYLGSLVPYIIWMLSHMRGYEGNILTVLFQVFCFNFGLYFLLQLSGSSFVSLCVMMVWYFLCINQLIPDKFNGMRINYLAKEIEKGWYFLQCGIGSLLLLAGEAIGIKGFFKKVMRRQF